MSLDGGKAATLRARSSAGRVILTGVLVCCLTGCVSSSKSAREGNELADHPLSETEKTHTEDLPTLLSKGGNSLKLGKDDEALYYFIKALDVQPGNLTALISIGGIHQRKGNDDLAELAYRLAVKQHPKSVDALEGLGLVQIRRNRPVEARQQLMAALALDRRRWRSHNGIGLLDDQAGDHRSAQDHFRIAIGLDAKNPQLLVNLGYSLYLSRHWREAMQQFDAALEIQPGLESAWLNKGLILARQGEEKQALKAFGKVLSDADAWNNLGYIYMTQGESDRAGPCFERAIALSPTYHAQANENLKRLNAMHN